MSFQRPIQSAKSHTIKRLSGHVEVYDGLGERAIRIIVMITPYRKDMGAVIGFRRFKDELISIIAKGKD
jgi:hypothetical protein